MIGFIASVLLAATSTIPDEVREQFGERMSAMGEPAQVLALSCIGHTIIAHDLEQFADTNPAFLRYDEGQAKPFLMGRPGKVWGVHVSKSNYAIVLADNGTCSVFAEKADRAKSISDLRALIDVLYPGAPVTRFDASKYGLAAPDAGFDGWSVRDDRYGVTYWFTAIVPQQEGALAQTVYSVFVARSEPQ